MIYKAAEFRNMQGGLSYGKAVCLSVCVVIPMSRAYEM